MAIERRHERLRASRGFWRRRATGLAAIGVLAAACGNAAEQGGSTETSASANHGAAAQAPAARQNVDDLRQAVPEDASLVVNVPRASDIAVPKNLMDRAKTLLTNGVARRTGAPEPTVRAAIDAFDGAAFFNQGNFQSKEPPFAAVVRFQDAKPVEDLIAALDMKKSDDGTYELDRQGRKLFVAWLPAPRVAIAATQKESLQAALDSLSGKRPAFANTARAKDVGREKLYSFADLHRLAPGKDDFAAAGSEVDAVVGREDTNVSLVENGPRVPRLGSILAPVSHGALESLPAGPTVALDLSLARRSGKSLGDGLDELGRATGSDLRSQVASRLSKLDPPISLDDLDRALGQSLALGVYTSASGKPSIDDPMGDSVLLGVLQTKDDKPARELVAALKKQLGNGSARLSPNEAVVDVGGGNEAIVRIEHEAVAAAFGPKADVEKILDQYEKNTSPLGKTSAYAAYQSKAQRSQLGIYVDYEALGKVLPASAASELPPTGVAAADLVLDPSDSGLDAKLTGTGAVFLLGATSSAAMTSVAQVMTTARVAEARAQLRAIATAAAEAYERRSGDPTKAHALCRTAAPASASVPPGEAVPADATTGDAATGWKCLGYQLPAEVYFQYEYRAGGPYKCVARGGTDPGPEGFEVSAEGDPDGDGRVSLYCLTGKPEGGKVKLSADIFGIEYGG